MKWIEKRIGRAALSATVKKEACKIVRQMRFSQLWANYLGTLVRLLLGFRLYEMVRWQTALEWLGISLSVAERGKFLSPRSASLCICEIGGSKFLEIVLPAEQWIHARYVQTLFGPRGKIKLSSVNSFSIAHEIGHIFIEAVNQGRLIEALSAVLDRRCFVFVDIVDKKSEKRSMKEEFLCDEFASGFLIPLRALSTMSHDALEPECEVKHPLKGAIALLRSLSNKFGISYQAVAIQIIKFLDISEHFRVKGYREIRRPCVFALVDADNPYEKKSNWFQHTRYPPAGTSWEEVREALRTHFSQNGVMLITRFREEKVTGFREKTIELTALGVPFVFACSLTSLDARHFLCFGTYDRSRANLKNRGKGA